MSPRPLTPREQWLIHRYCYGQPSMTPQRFYAKWQVSHEEMAGSVTVLYPPCAAGFALVAATAAPPSSTSATWG